jgi:hypothetical protein
MAVVAAVDERAVNDVGFRLRTAPPFELPQTGIDGHQVFLGDAHAAFVFWGGDPEAALVRLSGDAGVRERITRAAEGLRAPRLLSSTFEWARPDGGATAVDRALAVVARGVEMREAGEAAGALVDALGAGLHRLRVFAGEGAGLVVIEHARGAAGTGATLDAVSAAAPVDPLRPLEVLGQTYWFEAGAQLSSRPAGGILSEPPAGG